MLKSALTLTFCYQYKSEYYDKIKLNACVSRAVDEINNNDSAFKIVYDPITEGLSSGIILENITKTIEKSQIVIFEISDINPNVLYELGLSKGLNKLIIILREESCSTPLPTDINSFLYINYSKNNLKSFHYTVAEKISTLIADYSPNDSVPAFIKESIIREKLLISEDRKVLLTTVIDFIRSTETNIYYIGSMHILSKNENLISNLKENLSGKIFSHIVSLKSLREIHSIYNDEFILRDYCVWLAQNYILLKDRVINLTSCPEVGIWNSRMSMMISDNNKILVSTGTFQDFLGKGFVISDPTIGAMFKEYAKILAVTSERITQRKIERYFSLSENINSIPSVIETALEKQDYPALKEACTSYIDEELSKKRLRG